MSRQALSTATKLSPILAPKAGYESLKIALPAEQPAQVKADIMKELENPTRLNKKTEKSFKLHVGGFLSIPTKNAFERPAYSHPNPDAQHTSAADALRDPFEGLPFRGLADLVGARVMPVVQAAKEEHQKAVREGRASAEQAEPMSLHVPHLLPFTRWAANNDSFKSTFIADDPKTRKKARLSWYHPEDTMVPRGWFTQGLMEDIKYYMPFGLGASKAEATQ